MAITGVACAAGIANAYRSIQRSLCQICLHVNACARRESCYNRLSFCRDSCYNAASLCVCVAFLTSDWDITQCATAVFIAIINCSAAVQCATPTSKRWYHQGGRLRTFILLVSRCSIQLYSCCLTDDWTEGHHLRDSAPAVRCRLPFYNKYDIATTCKFSPTSGSFFASSPCQQLLCRRPASNPFRASRHTASGQQLCHAVWVVVMGTFTCRCWMDSTNSWYGMGVSSDASQICHVTRPKARAVLWNPEGENYIGVKWE